MSRVTRGGSAPAGSSLLLLQPQGRGRGIAGGGGGAREDGGDEGLGLFSRNRRSASVAADEESDGQNAQVNLGRISVGQARLMRSGMDDLLSAADMGKHDYDWLLTPPGTPLVSTLEARESHLPSVASRSNLSARSTSTTTASRFSVPQQETKQPARPARSSSATRLSITNYSSSQLSSSSRTSILNTSTASISSSRPSTPGNRSSSSSRTRPSAPASSRPTPSRSSTPSKTRPATPGDKPRPLHCSRPSTPTQRSHIPATSNSNPSSITSAPSRSSSRPSTPTRRVPVQSSVPAPARAPSVGRTASASSRTPGPASRPSSPGPRIRPPPQPLVLPDFPLDAPPNLRTKIPERPASAGRARPGHLLMARSSSHAEAAPPASSNRRQSMSPVVTRGRLPDNSPKRRLQSNGHDSRPPDGPNPMLRESAVPKTTARSTVAADSTGFGRTISKKSFDMALRHMDIRQSIPGVRGASLFPQSIRSTASMAITPTRISDDHKAPVFINGAHPAEGHYSCNGASYINGATPEHVDIDLSSHDGEVHVGRANESDMYENSRYDVILLKEDARNTNWLHSVESKPDQSPVFDLRFETLPEPFVLL
ncbi:hypothetical protein Taro_019279 [Colocasia esculenta]|uniref:Uncharacterized protein n=1 Tax=Colocasia esculenta TaxID=4460 RepID=A0A843UKQ0_COLES|nr:hypothetical protein [Colocasia esculenta]